jgi:Ni,Fe-hydrogenase I large subunit
MTEPLPPDQGVVAQILAAVTQLSQEFADFRETAAKATDLHALVPREIYETQRTADQQMATLTATRLTNIESSINTLKDDFHRFQIADARQSAQTQVATSQQIGQAQTTALATGAQVAATTTGMVNKIKDILLGALAAGFISLLVYVATHSLK